MNIAILIFCLVYFVLCHVVAKSSEEKGYKYSQGFLLAALSGLFLGAIILEMLPEKADRVQRKIIPNRCPSCQKPTTQGRRSCVFCGKLL